MRVVQHRSWEIERGGIALAGDFFNFGSAGVMQAEHFADLVVGFARGVIARAAEFVVAAGTFHIEQQGVTAGNDEREMRWHLGFAYEGRKQMAFKVVDREKR